MTTLARYREAHSSATGCLHDNPSCKCRECECRGIWSPDVHGYKCKDSCAWVKALGSVPGMEAVEDYEPAPASTAPASPGPRAKGTERLWWYEKDSCIHCGNDARVAAEETGVLLPPIYAIHEDSRAEGMEYPLCEDCGSRATPTCDEIWEFIRRKKLMLPTPMREFIKTESLAPTDWGVFKTCPDCKSFLGPLHVDKTCARCGGLGIVAAAP